MKRASDIYHSHDNDKSQSVIMKREIEGTMIMKKFALVGLLIFLLLLSVGCTQYVIDNGIVVNTYSETSMTDDIVDTCNETDYVQEHEVLISEAIDWIEFLSLEDFLATNEALRTGGDLTGFVADWAGAGESLVC